MCRSGRASRPRWGRCARPRRRSAQVAHSHAPNWAPPGRAAGEEFFRKNSCAREGPAFRPCCRGRASRAAWPTPGALAHASRQHSVGRAAAEEFFRKNSYSREGPISRLISLQLSEHAGSDVRGFAGRVGIACLSKALPPSSFPGLPVFCRRQARIRPAKLSCAARSGTVKLSLSSGHRV